LLLLPLLAVIDDVTDESTTESDELGLSGMPAVAAGLIGGPLAVIVAAASCDKPTTTCIATAHCKGITATGLSECVERIGLGGVA
jgi:hypothetical protein